MQIIYSLADLPKKPLVMTLGFFDGIHKGHIALFNRIKEFKKTNPHFIFTLLTFEIPPSHFIKSTPAHNLFTVQERIQLFKELEVDILCFIPMHLDFFSTPALTFLKNLLTHSLRIHFIVGEEAKFGKDQKGGKSFLEETLLVLGKNFTYDCLPNINSNNKEKISSSVLRQALHHNDLNFINNYLIKPLFIEGQVIHGEKKGRLIGFPTLNIPYIKNKIAPAFGVYKSFTTINNIAYHSLTYISTRRLDLISPTPLAEIWVHNFNEEIYGQTVINYLLEYKRPPITVSTLEKLKELLDKDKQSL